MHLFLCVLAGFIVISLGMMIIAIYSHKEGPDEEEQLGKIRNLYPHIPDPEDAQIENNTPEWKIKRSQAN